MKKQSYLPSSCKMAQSYICVINQLFGINRVFEFFISDTAAVYQNEEAIGLALKDLLPKYNLKREDIFITTKLCMYVLNYLLEKHIDIGNFG